MKTKLGAFAAALRQRHIRPLSLVFLAFAVLAVYLLPARTQTDNATQFDSINGVKLPSDPVTLSEQNRGVVFKNAAINTDGSVAACFRCVRGTTIHLGTGTYQVAFDENVQATNGWSRWVQADTLTTGAENAWCNTADRSGDTNAIYVNCQHEGGPGSNGNSAPVDTSFFIFVAR